MKDILQSAVDDVMAVLTARTSAYASPGDIFSNFKDAAMIAGVDIDTVFRVFIASKLARLRTLQENATDDWDAIRDNRLDLTAYGLLYLAAQCAGELDGRIDGLDD